MFLRIRWLALISGCTAVLAVAPPLHGEEGPFLGIWARSGRGGLYGDLVLYQAVMRYQNRASLRAAGLLPLDMRAQEDSLHLQSDRYDDFIVLQDSLGLGWLPPTWARLKGREYLTNQVSVQLDSSSVTESEVLNGTPVSPPVRVPISQYLAEMTRRNFRTLWASAADQGLQQIETKRGGGGLLPALSLPIEMPDAVKSIVGAGKPNLVVRGSEKISFSGTSRWYPDRPETEFTQKQSKFPQLDMKQDLNLQLTGNIGDKVSVDVDQSSEATTPLANRIKIHYKGYDDEIIQRVDLGNTSLSLPGTQYVSYGGQAEGLFGVNAQALVGDVEVDGILSKQEAKNDTRSLTKGAEVTTRTISDYEYVQGKFFFLTDPDGPPLTDLVPGSVQVWMDDRTASNNLENMTTPVYVTLSGDAATARSDTAKAIGNFKRLVNGDDYVVQSDVYTGYPVLVLSDAQVMDGQMSKAMAVNYTRQPTGGGPPVYVGGVPINKLHPGDPDTLVLKLIRPAADMGGTNPNDLTQGIFAPTRNLEMRNVYGMGRNLSPDGLVVRIHRRGTVGGITDPDRIGDHTFLEILDLDHYTDSGENQTPGPDGKIDRGRINYDSGYVIFRELQPFAPTPQDIQRRFYEARPDTLKGDLAVPLLYTRSNWSSAGVDPLTISGYYFEVTAKSAVSQISLNAFNILQGSEVVTAGGRTLVRDHDYTIDYDAGVIQILDAADVRDTDEIRVSYSYLPFGGAAEKTLMGTAFRYRPQDSKLGLSTTWIYESKGAPGVEGRRPRLGQEPTRTLVGELAANYKSDSWLLTSLVDKIPLVNAQAKSNFSLDGGVGLSLPNPNTTGQLYVDDFEGAQDVFSVGMSRITWRASSVPRNAPGSTLDDKLDNRGECWWYSPLTAVKEGDLQPTRADRGGLADAEKQNNRQILELHFFPRGVSPDQKKASWFSLVQPLSQRGTDLSRAQFLDIWVNDFHPPDPPSERAQRQGKIHMDIGVVSEDAVWARLDPDSSTFALNVPSFKDPNLRPNGRLDTEDKNLDGVLDNDEDTGLDGIYANQEPGYDPSSNPEPNFDVYSFDQNQEKIVRDLGIDQTSLDKLRVFKHINGMENNGRLDTEDLNGNGYLDTSESYFHFVVDLADTSHVEYEAARAPDQKADEYSAHTFGWRRIRLPLTPQFYDSVGNPSWTQIRHIRIWLEGFDHETRLQIGGIDITGNRWIKGTIRDAKGAEIPQPVLQARGEDFFPGVLNNKDNSTAEYTPPVQPLVQSNVAEREQSLTLEMQNFQGGDRATVFRTFAQPQDFASLYRTMQFYLNRKIRAGPDPNLEFFVRLARDAATDEKNYYEYRIPVTDGWTLRSIDLAQLSRLQLADTCRVDTCLVSEHLDNGATISRYGAPSLTTIQRIAFGVVNLGPAAVAAGDVWVDELRLTSVKKDVGVASRFAIGMTLSDLGSLNLNYDRQDANFLKIGSETGSGVTHTSLGFSSRVNLEKFFEGTGLKVPTSFSLNTDRQVPKFRTNSDLVLQRATDRDISESDVKDLSFTVQRVRGENPLLKYTLDALNLTGHTGSNVSNTPQSRSTTTSSTGSVTYALPIQGGPPIRVYKDTSLKLLPTSLSISVSGTQEKSRRFSRANGDLNEPYVLDLQNLTKNGSLSWSTGLRPTDAISYSFDQERDLRLSAAPRRFLGFRVGTEVSRRHQLSANQSFRLFGGNLVPKVSWTGGSDGRFNSIQSGTGVSARSNAFNNTSSLTFSGSLPLDRLLSRFPLFGGAPGAPAPAETGEEAPPDTTQPVRRVRSTPHEQGARRELVHLSPIAATYAIGRSNSMSLVGGEPSILYQLGLSRDAGARVQHLYQVVDTGSGPSLLDISSVNNSDHRDLNLQTDFKILSEITVRTTYQHGYSKSLINNGGTTQTTQTFPDMDINWGRLNKILGIERFAKDLRASTRYTRETRDTGTTTAPKDRSETTISLRPLLNLDTTLGNGISSKLTSSYSTTDAVQYGVAPSLSRSRNRQLGVSMRRTLNLTRMVTNPITKKASKVTSKLDVSLSIDFQDDRQEYGPPGSLVVTEDRAKLAVSTTGGYNFTSSITGNAGVTVGQDTDRKNRTNTARYVSVTVSAAFNF